MKMTFEVTSNIDIPKHLRAVEDGGFWTFAASTWYKLYFDFVPYRNGQLSEDIVIRPKEIEHKAPYAAAVYSANRNFRRDTHPLASTEWDNAAIPTQGDKLIEAMQKYVDSGRLNLKK